MGVVIRRWVWLDTIGVVSGCFPHITYISLLQLYLLFFAAVIYMDDVWHDNYIGRILHSSMISGCSLQSQL